MRARVLFAVVVSGLLIGLVAGGCTRIATHHKMALSPPCAAPDVPAAEEYEGVTETGFIPTESQPLSTFSIDVDTASYSNVRRFLEQGQLPPRDAVRIEELINYFEYGYPDPTDGAPISANTEVADCPWNPETRLVRIGLKARDIPQEDRPPSNLVFLIDVSGSMADANKLPLVQRSLRMLVSKLERDDRVGIVTYAGSSEVALRSIRCGDSNRSKIAEAIERLGAGGSTHGSAGIEDAYALARENFIGGGANRVIIATDGDFNVGITNRDELVEFIQKQAETGVFLTVLGFGMGNIKDATLENLADKGNGHYAYIDTLSEARKVLVEQMGATLITMAKDVKIQVEFNPARVAAYRLVGYENRLLRAEDFNDDEKDAGEMGAGHQVTALYEVVPPGAEVSLVRIDPLRYRRVEPSPAAQSGELLSLKIRYKEPEAGESKLLKTVVMDTSAEFADSTDDFRFAAAVAGFGMLLRGSEYKGGLTYDAVFELAQASRGPDACGYRAEFVNLVRNAKELDTRPRL